MDSYGHSNRDALKEIAALLGLKKLKHAYGSRVVITRAVGVEKVAKMVDELETLKQSTTGKRTLENNGSIPANNVDYNADDSSYVEPKVNRVSVSISWGTTRDDVRYIPLNGGFHWDDRLQHVLNNEKLPTHLANLSFDFATIGLCGGEVFRLVADGPQFQVVGRKPRRCKYELVAVRRTVLEDRSYVLLPTDLRLFCKDVLN